MLYTPLEQSVIFQGLLHSTGPVTAMPFAARVFDHSRFIDGFDKEDTTIIVRDDLLLELANEVQASSVIFTVENYMTSKITSQGYTIEFTQVGRRYTITNEHTNRVMYVYWEEEVKKMIVHILRYGFCAIRYHEMKNQDDGFAPRTMDPVHEYSVRFRINEDGTREYLAYERDKIIQDKPIPNSRVFILYPPEADGTLNSPLQKCFADLQRIHGYWNRNEQQDFRGTNPLFIYEVESKKEGLIPATMPQAMQSEYDNMLQNSVGYLGVENSQLESMYSYELGDKFLAQRFNDDLQNGQIPDDNMYKKVWNPNIQRFTDVPMPHPFRPEKLLPQNIRLARGAPQPKALVNFNQIIEDLSRSIANCYGVPAEVLTGARGQFAANVQFSTEQLNATVQMYQRSLERFIVQMYLDIYVDDHLQLINGVFTEMNHARIQRSAAKRTETESTTEQSDRRDTKRKANDILLSEADRLALEKEVIVEVHFNVNPTFDFETLKMYKDERIISQEDFQRIALSMEALPWSIAVTPEQMEAEARQQAKLDKILNPDPPQQATSSKPSRPATSASKQSDNQKKRKTSEKSST